MSDVTVYKVGGAGCGARILKIKSIVEPLAENHLKKLELM